MPHLLLVAGSPELAAHLEGKLWAHELLERRVARLPRGSLVLSGGGEGPASWALTLAAARGLRWVELSRSGVRRQGGKAASVWSPRAVGPAAHREALVEAAVKAQGSGWTVALLALVLRAEATEGATPGMGPHELARLAGEWGLPCDRMMWPPKTRRAAPGPALRTSSGKPKVAIESAPEGEAPRWLQVLRRERER